MARDWWQRGRGLDLWSVPHFLFGILMGMVPPLFGTSITTAFLLTLLLAILWETFEKGIGVRESLQNILFDIILSVLAFILTAYTLAYYQLHPDDLIVIASAVAILFAYTNLSGWRAFRRRHRDFIH